MHAHISEKGGAFLLSFALPTVVLTPMSCGDTAGSGSCQAAKQTQKVQQPLKGYVIAVAGKLSKTADAFRTVVEEHGGLFREKVRGNVNMLVASEAEVKKMSCKVAQAAELNISVVREDWIWKTIEVGHAVTMEDNTEVFFRLQTNKAQPSGARSSSSGQAAFQTKQVQQPLKGYGIAVAGMLSKTAADFRKIVEENGGLFCEKIRHNVDMLVAEEAEWKAMSGKVAQAARLNISVVREDWMWKTIELGHAVTVEDNAEMFLTISLGTSVPAADFSLVLKKFKASGETTSSILNKEYLPLARADLLTCANAWDEEKDAQEVMAAHGAHGITITRKDLLTLAPGQKVNDQIVQFYTELLKDRSHLSGFSEYLLFDVAFCTYLIRSDYEYTRIKESTRRIDVFSHAKLIFPVYCCGHWTVAVVNLRDKAFEYYDSLGDVGQWIVERLQQWVVHEHEEKKQCTLDISSWAVRSPGRQVPQQQNKVDCGVFALQFMNCLAQDMEYTFTQQYIDYFRKRFVVEILNDKIL